MSYKNNKIVDQYNSFRYDAPTYLTVATAGDEKPNLPKRSKKKEIDRDEKF